MCIAHCLGPQYSPASLFSFAPAPVADYISHLFIEAQLASEAYIEHNEKLHATLLNSKWRKRSRCPLASTRIHGRRLQFLVPDSSRFPPPSSHVKLFLGCSKWIQAVSGPRGVYASPT